MIVAVLGAGGHGQDIAAIAEALGHEIIWFDDYMSGPGRCATRHLPDDHLYVVGVNDPATRRRLAAGSNPVTLVHPTATVADSADIFPGCVVGAGTHIGPEVTLGDHVHVGAGCTLTRTTIGAYTTVSPGVDIAGDVTIGEECLIGVGATVSNLVHIGDRVTIGAGAVVVRNAADDQTVICRNLTATGAT